MAKENPEVEELKQIRKELRNIESNTSAKWWIIHGMLYGAGWIVGSLIALVLIGWALAALGVIPGLSRVVTDFTNAFSHLSR